ncbi:MAG: M1 family aminopeptidase, partial [Chitinophagaceae bacterium]
SSSLAAQETIDPFAYAVALDSICHQEKAAYGKRLSALAANGAFSVASPNYTIYYSRFQWYLDPAVRYIKGSVTHSIKITEAASSVTLDLFNSLQVDSIFFRGNPTTFFRTPDHGLHINFPVLLPQGTQDSLLIFYQGDPGGGGFGSFYQTTHSGVPVIWTLSEPYGAREWWPCKNSLTDKIDSTDIIIACPEMYQPSANGVIKSNKVQNGIRLTHFQHRYPLASYLLGVAITNYTIHTDTLLIGNDILTLQNFAYPEKSAGFNGYKDFHRNAFLAFYKWAGPYPFRTEKYGHTQWDWNGGMEHQTNSFVNNPTPFLAAHELAHQWFGDQVTCGSWQDIWLNEGFATYFSGLFNEYAYPKFFKEQLNSMLSSIVSSPGGSVFVEDTSSINRIFSGRLSYNKGAYVVHMLRWVLGDAVFSKGIQRYLQTQSLQSGFATTKDLQLALEQESGKNLTAFFKSWIYGEGYPNYQANWTENLNQWVRIELLQSTSHPSVSFYSMPVEIWLKGNSAEKRIVVNHTYSGQVFWVNAGFDVDSLWVDPDQWILAKSKSSQFVKGSQVANAITVFPNPSSGQVSLQIANPRTGNYVIRLLNMFGQEIHRNSVASSGEDILIHFPFISLQKGVYIFQLVHESGWKTSSKWIRQ